VTGIPIPSTSPVFLAIVAVHVLLGLACVGTGLFAMFSSKGRGRHSRFGSIYFWWVLAAFVSASALAFVRWQEDYPLFILGALLFATAYLARESVRRRWSSSRLSAEFVAAGRRKPSIVYFKRFTPSCFQAPARQLSVTVGQARDSAERATGRLA
jgi:hypothetical protein